MNSSRVELKVQKGAALGSERTKRFSRKCVRIDINPHTSVYLSTYLKRINDDMKVCTYSVGIRTLTYYTQDYTGTEIAKDNRLARYSPISRYLTIHLLDNLMYLTSNLSYYALNYLPRAAVIITPVDCLLCWSIN